MKQKKKHKTIPISNFEAFDILSEVETSLKDSVLSNYLISHFKEVPLVAEVDDVRLKG